MGDNLVEDTRRVMSVSVWPGVIKVEIHIRRTISNRSRTCFSISRCWPVVQTVSSTCSGSALSAFTTGPSLIASGTRAEHRHDADQSALSIDNAQKWTRSLDRGVSDAFVDASSALIAKVRQACPPTAAKGGRKRRYGSSRLVACRALGSATPATAKAACQDRRKMPG